MVAEMSLAAINTGAYCGMTVSIVSMARETNRSIRFSIDLYFLLIGSLYSLILLLTKVDKLRNLMSFFESDEIIFSMFLNTKRVSSINRFKLESSSFSNKPRKKFPMDLNVSLNNEAVT